VLTAECCVVLLLHNCWHWVVGFAVLRQGFTAVIAHLCCSTALGHSFEGLSLCNHSAICCVQEATPAALLTANDMLLKLEGTGSAQALQLPQGTGLTAALATRASSSAAAAAVVACKLGVGAGSAALPQVHSVLLQHLDLVPSGGGLEAAGLRFMQLQVCVVVCADWLSLLQQPYTSTCRLL
jgi:hypothetical protein